MSDEKRIISIWLCACMDKEVEVGAVTKIVIAAETGHGARTIMEWLSENKKVQEGGNFNVVRVGTFTDSHADNIFGEVGKVDDGEAMFVVAIERNFTPPTASQLLKGGKGKKDMIDFQKSIRNKKR